MNDPVDRYHRQTLLPGVGVDGQARLRESRALIVGCGALGTVIADALTRAGVGALTIIDRDVVEWTNLQRQTLFVEDDARHGAPKAIAAKTRLGAVNADVTIDAHVDDFNARNAERYAAGADILLDGLDNFETRYLLNDLAVKTGRPYIYGGAVATTGMSMTILPYPGHEDGAAGAGRITWDAADATPCLRCVFPEAPPPGAAATCDTAGVLGPAAMMAAAFQAGQAIKLLAGGVGAADRSLYSFDLWSNLTQRFDFSGARSDACPCCGARSFPYLAGSAASRAVSLCGRNAVQIAPPEGCPGVDLATLATRLAPHGAFEVNAYFLRGRLTGETAGPEATPLELTIFPNGRAVVRGVDEIERARAIVARYVGV